MRKTALALALALLLPACGGNGGSPTVEELVARLAPQLAACTELRAAELLRIAAAVQAIADGPAGPFEEEVDFDGDGAPDLTITGEIVDAGGSLVVDVELSGALFGSGTLLLSPDGSGGWTVGGSGQFVVTADPDNCTFVFESEQFPDGTPSDCTVDFDTRNADGSLAGVLSCEEEGELCADDLTLTLPQPGWSGTCDGPCPGYIGKTQTGEPFCFPIDEVFGEPGGDRLEDCLAEADAVLASVGGFLTAIAVDGALPAGFAALPNANEYQFQIELPSPKGTLSGRVLFPRDPSALQNGDTVLFGGIGFQGAAGPVLFTGDPSPPIASFTGLELRVAAGDAVWFIAENATLTLPSCEVSATAGILFEYSTAPALDEMTGSITLDFVETFGPRHVYSGSLELLAGPVMELSGLVQDGQDVTGTRMLPARH